MKLIKLAQAPSGAHPEETSERVSEAELDQEWDLQRLTKNGIYNNVLLLLVSRISSRYKSKMNPIKFAGRCSYQGFVYRFARTIARVKHDQARSIQKPFRYSRAQ
jgi:hypothetical protein